MVKDGVRCPPEGHVYTGFDRDSMTSMSHYRAEIWRGPGTVEGWSLVSGVRKTLEIGEMCSVCSVCPSRPHARPKCPLVEHFRAFRSESHAQCPPKCPPVEHFPSVIDKGKCSNTSGVSSCMDCGAGKYLTAEGSSQKKDCESCGLGSYSTQTGQTSSTTCVKCTVGNHHMIHMIISESMRQAQQSLQ